MCYLCLFLLALKGLGHAVFCNFCLILSIEGLCAKRAYIAFLADFFIFCRIKLIFGRLTCVDMKNIVP